MGITIQKKTLPLRSQRSNGGKEIVKVLFSSAIIRGFISIHLNTVARMLGVNGLSGDNFHSAGNVTCQ